MKRGSNPTVKRGSPRKADVGLTHDQIGAELGISRERVRQIEISALAKLRAAWKKHDPQLFDE